MVSIAGDNKNEDFTLIARDCVGGVVYHQLGLRFLSPTINLFLTPADFNLFCLSLREYLSVEVTEDLEAEEPYPVGILAGEGLTPIRVHFMHYEDFASAKAKWEERKARVNYDNLFVISSFCYAPEVATLSPKLIEEWNHIPYRKAVLVDKPYGFDDEFVIAKPEECEEFAWLLFAPNPEEPWRRTFNDFDFIRFLNP